MKVLIITYYYKHKNAMASVRAVKLAKYLSRQGHSVTVLTSDQKDTWTKNYSKPIADSDIKEIYAPEIPRWSKISGYLNHRKEAGVQRASKDNSAQKAPSSAPKASLKTKIRSLLVWLFYFTVAKQEDICMFKGLKVAAEKECLKDFDTVIATYPTYGAFLAGMWFKKKGYCKSLIADFRDPLYNPGFRDKKLEANYDRKCLKNIVKYADSIVCVSKGIAQSITDEFPTLNKPVEIITNGYDAEDVSENDVQVDFDENKINFVYAGALYHGRRCVDMLASVLKELIEEGEIQEDGFAFHYAGSDFSELVEQLSQYGLAETAVDHGFVSREESIAMQKNGSALLLLTWNEKNYQGVIPGKLYEYMSIETVPIIALITGDVVNSEVAVMVRASGAGIACEQASTEDVSSLKSFVSDLFKNKCRQTSSVKQYSYDKIAEKYSDVMRIGYGEQN